VCLLGGRRESSLISPVCEWGREDWRMVRPAWCHRSIHSRIPSPHQRGSANNTVFISNYVIFIYTVSIVHHWALVKYKNITSPCVVVTNNRNGVSYLRCYILVQSLCASRRIFVHGLIEGNVKCRNLKKFTRKGTFRQVFICLRSRTPQFPPPPYTLFTCMQ
jgi:hypothetical protein